MNKILKKTKGVTLIAMVVTIIILLILATISIALLTNIGIIEKTKEATVAYDEKEAKEKINLKITNVEMKSYAESQQMPSLQELADTFCEDKDFEYVNTKRQKNASLEKIVVGDATSIFTKLNSYPYEFEIDNNLKLASIDGVKIADSGTVNISTEQYDNILGRLNALESSIRFKQIVKVTWTNQQSEYIANTTGGTSTIDLTSYKFEKTPYAIVSGAIAMTAIVTSVTTTSVSFNHYTAWGSMLGKGFGTVEITLMEPY